MNIGIIGGGITGLTTALALKKVGLSCVVYEQAEQLNEIGAGIMLQPNALKVLEWLGVKKDIMDLGVVLNKMEVTNTRLVPVKKIKSEVVQDREGNKTLALHRARLQKTLYQEVLKSSKIHLGKRYKSHKNTGDSIQIQFEDSDTQVDLLLGADGIHSSLRKALFPGSSLRNSRQICWRGVCNYTLAEKLRNQGFEAWGKQLRFGFVRIFEDEVYWFAVANESHLAEAEAFGINPYLVKLFKGFSPVIQDMIQQTDASSIHTSVIYDLNRLPQWYADRICLLGDAAHATTPNMGQGACQGIEDAYYISQLLSQFNNEPSSAFLLFQEARRKKVDYVVNNSWRFGKMAHNTAGQNLLKLIMKITPERVMSDQMNKLYELEPV
jgi:2-polyprenyl-6-methoxyphenol hydroxylase-like FAD-dependent oxidoreductase